MMGLISLSYRSSYELKKIEEILERDQEVRERLGIDLSNATARQRFAVENMINIVTQQTTAFVGGTVDIFFDSKKPLLVCERPGFDMAPRNYTVNAIPVGPTSFIFMNAQAQPPAMIHGPVFRESGDETKMIDSMNSFTVKRARKWVVASTKEELEAVKPLLTPELIDGRRKKDISHYIELSDAERARGWRLRDSD